MQNSPGLEENTQPNLPGIAYILAFLIGILLFLILSEPLFDLKPEMIWIARLMGLSVAAIVLWVWSEIRKRNENND